MGRRYHLLLAAYLISSLGNWIYRLTLPLLVLHLTGSALHTGALYAIEYLPILLLSIPGGLLADRINRRKVLIGGDVIAMVIAGTLTSLVAAGVPPVWAIYALVFLLACVDPIYTPSFQSLVPHLVPAEHLARANSRLYAGDNIVNLAGPAIAGVLVASVGFSLTILIDAMTFLVSAVLIVTIGSIRRTGSPEPVQRARRGIAQVVRYITRENRLLLIGSAVFFTSNYFIWLIHANLVFYLTTYHGFTAVTVGIVLAAQGGGALIGALAAPRILARIRPGRLIVSALAGSGIAVLLLVIARGPVLISAAWALQLACGACTNVAWMTLRQQTTPDALLGRTVAVTRMIAWSSVPLGALTAGGLETAIGNMYLIWIVAGTARILIAAMAWRPLTRARPPLP